MVVAVSFAFCMNLLCVPYDESGFMPCFYIQITEKSLFLSNAKISGCLHFMQTYNYVLDFTF